VSTTGTDIVVVSLEAWDEVWRRNQYLVDGLLQQDPASRVLFVEPPADPFFAASRWQRPVPGRGLRQPGRGSRSQDSRLWLYQPTKWLPRKIDKNADRRLARAVVRAAARLGLDEPVLWVNDAGGSEIVEQSGWPALYDITDDWLLASVSTAERERLARSEAALLDRCAEVVVCSPALARSKGERRSVHLVTNGVDLDRYRRPQSRPADLPEGPVALYVGTVHPDRFDVGCAIDAARHLEGRGHLVVVGPVLDLERAVLERMADAGIVLLGARPRDEVPAYLQHADVLVVPHVVTPFTESLDPIKLYEYLAVGRPIVSTAVAGFRDTPQVTTTSAEEFGVVVRDVLADGVPTGGEGHPVEVPTWERQAARMSAVIDLVMSRQPARPR